MSINSKRKASHSRASATTAITLQHLLNALEGPEALSVTRRRDLRSAVTRVACLLGEQPRRILLDLPALSIKLAAVNPIAASLTSKTFSNIRSDFMAAVKVSQLMPVRHCARAQLSADWTKLLARLPDRRARIGLSRLARYASDLGIAPEHVNDAAMEEFIAAVRTNSLHRKPNKLHKTVALIWNEVAREHGLNLQLLAVPSFRRVPKNIEWAQLPDALRDDVSKFLTWSGGSDAFAADARVRPLGPRTLELRWSQIRAAVTALVDSGVKPSMISSLADLVSPENFKRILRRRNETAGGRENAFNRNLADVLVRIAREWVKVDVSVLAELTRLASRVPTPISGLTDKNKRFLRQFDDPEVLPRLFNLPGRLWAEVKRDATVNPRTLAKAQTAIAVIILCYMPLRVQNLAALAFDVHLFLREGPRATSTLELSAGEVKNRMCLAFDIPPSVTKMLIEYRNHIAPKFIGHRPERLFVNIDGTPKSQKMVAWLIAAYLRKRAGIVITAHQFRHLSAKILLDAEPGNFETVRQLLGHKSLSMTVGAYAGIDSRRAARHHQYLVEQTLAAAKPMR